MDTNNPAKQTETLSNKDTGTNQINGYDLSKLLLKTSRIMAGFETLDEMLEALMDIVTDELDVKRCTIFLSDPDTKELYSRVAGGGNVRKEIRIKDNSGVAGHVFTSGQSTIVHDAYNDERFDKSVDEKTGFETESILCTPIKTVRGEIIGVAQALNKRHGQFTDGDREILDELLTHSAIVLQSTQNVERGKALHEQERKFAQVVSDIIAELDLKQILKKVMAQATEMIKCDRTTLFLNDERTGELFSRVGEGLGFEIRIPNTAGIAGAVFTSGETVNIPNAYRDSRFNPSTDKKTGYFTKSMLCVPVVNKETKRIIGATQALNKKGGPFTKDDEFRLRTFTAQVSNAMENAKLFSDIQNFKNRSERMLESMPTGVIALDDAGKITSCNKAAFDIFNISDEDTLETQEDIDKDERKAKKDYEEAKAKWEYAKNKEEKEKKKWKKTLNMEWLESEARKDWKAKQTAGLNEEGKRAFDKKEDKLWKLIKAEMCNKQEKLEWIKVRKKEWKDAMTVCENKKKVWQAIKNKKAGKEPRLAEYFFVGKNEWIMKKVKLVRENMKKKPVRINEAKEDNPDAEIEVGGKNKVVNLTVLPLVGVKKDEKDEKDENQGTMIIFEDISENKRMHSTMARHMGSSVAEELLADGQDNLKGKEEIATVLFSDIRGFTTLTEKHGAKGTVELLNEYFTIMVECIDQNKGWVNKFIGDAIMAGFGVPKRTENHEECGVRAAIAMLKRLYEWNEKRIERDQKTVDMGIGINTDKVVTGNIGSFGTDNSPARIEYTMIGDGVNLAARLETACKQYSARIIVSEYTYKSLRGVYRSREIDSVVVKGKTEPVTIYEILDYHTEQSFPNIMDVINHFKSGLVNYRKQHWDKAIDAFKEALKANPEDKLSDMYIKRCEHCKVNPPGEDWDGVWVMTEK